jgi:CRISPR/Cas system CSM-associated protein Csm2 small subunit
VECLFGGLVVVIGGALLLCPPIGAALDVGAKAATAAIGAGAVTSVIGGVIVAHNRTADSEDEKQSRSEAQEPSIAIPITQDREVPKQITTLNALDRDIREVRGEVHDIETRIISFRSPLRSNQERNLIMKLSTLRETLDELLKCLLKED